MAPGFKSGGRRKGSRNKLNFSLSDTLERAEDATRSRRSLKEMRWIADWFIDKAKQSEAERDENGRLQIAKAAGYLRDAVHVLKGIAEYEYPKLANVTMQGDPNRPQVTRIEVELVESRHESPKVIEHVKDVG